MHQYSNGHDKIPIKITNEYILKPKTYNYKRVTANVPQPTKRKARQINSKKSRGKT